MPISSRKIRVGVCAMDKKARSKAMSEILTRLEKFGEFEIVVFGDDVILNQPVELWPKVDALLSWFSDGFPLAKAESYSKLHHPIYMVNDLNRQWDLLDRRVVYKILKAHDIPTPPHIVANRNDPAPAGTMPTHAVDFEAENFAEYEDYVEVNGERIDKPFVEKPADAENHNICIYYPHAVGGGYKALFRKVGNQASKYYPPPVLSSEDAQKGDKKPYALVRRDTSFIYENFMSTGGTDVKVYTVGPNYAHAEARKSPVVDGRVQRDANGKEERFPVLLTPEEKEIARRVCLAFGQMVCGFDLLRTKGRSYVCDVNGWSFVKNSTKYFDDASLCLRAMILRAVAPDHRRTAQAAAEAEEQTNEREVEREEGDVETPTTPKKTGSKGVKTGAGPTKTGYGEEGPAEELRAVLAVIRHGDRTPKQKMKMKVRHAPLLDLLSRCTSGRPRKQAKLKTPKRLQELLNICRLLYSDCLKEGRRFAAAGYGDGGDAAAGPEPGPSGDAAGDSGDPDVRGAGDRAAQTREEWEEELEQWKQVVSILQEGGHFSGINRKAQLKPLAWARVPEEERGEPAADGKEPPSERVTEALLILKFGGVLTHLGKNQAEFLGRDFRMRMYPGGNYYDEGNTDGLLRLHSTYRHDLKIYSSDEGRVQITAAAFAKGLLDLETSNNQLTPILASLVNKDAKLLDFVTHEVEEDILHAKQKLYNIMTEGHVKGRGPNKEYSTSDTAVFDDDFERSGPVGYLRRTSANAVAIKTPSSKKSQDGDKHSAGERGVSVATASDAGANARAAGKPKGGAYALMSADRARALKMARKSLSKAASSAMSSLREAMLSAMVTGVAEEKPRSAAAGKAPSPPARDAREMEKKKSADDLTELNRKLDERWEGREELNDGEYADGGGHQQLPPSREVSPIKSAASPSRASLDEMASVVGRMDVDDADFAPLPSGAGGAGGDTAANHPNASTDEEQEYRLSLERDRGGSHVPPAHLARSSWNAGEAKRMLQTRLALGLPETAEASLEARRANVLASPLTSPTKSGAAVHSGGDFGSVSRRTSLDVGDDVAGLGAEDFKVSVEGSITRRPPGVPPEPLKLLRVMVDLIGGVTRQLREEIFKHSHSEGPGVGSPTTWVDTLGAVAPRGSIPEGGLAALKLVSTPAGGESFLLMHARWKKLEQDIYHPRKGRFDISKVPDVYDSAKYDAIHNSHLEIEGLEELYRVSRCLAEGVVPNEYGTHPQSKLRIGGTIAHSLLLKLMQDMFTTREESFVGLPAFARPAVVGSWGRWSQSLGQHVASDAGATSLATDSDASAQGGATEAPGQNHATDSHLDSDSHVPLAGVDEEDAAALKEEEEIEVSTTRLNHRYAGNVGVHSPHRHVRTRLYFTSESHIHSLLNVLRYCNLEAGTPRRSVSDAATAGASFSSPGSPDGKSAKEDKSVLSSPPPSLLSRRVETLENIGDLDYLTHIVFRMYECFDVPAADPNRFRVEILLSTGVGLDPFKQNVIAEFDAAAAEANRREKQSASPLNRTRAEENKRDKDREKTGLQRAGGSDAARLPLLRQFPIHNDRAHDAVRVAGTSGAKKTSSRTEPELKTELKTDERAEYLTLNDLESYLWKFRKNRLAQPGGGGGSGGNSTDWASPRKESADPGTPAKPQKSGLGVGGPKRSVKKKTKKKGSDSESD